MRKKKLNRQEYLFKLFLTFFFFVDYKEKKKFYLYVISHILLNYKTLKKNERTTKKHKIPPCLVFWQLKYIFRNIYMYNQN